MIDWRRFAVALAAATALVLSAPFLGLIRSTLRRVFPDSFVTIVLGLLAAGVLVALGAAVVRIRERRRTRFALIGLALVLALAYATATASDNPESAAVEVFHFLQYGVVTFLFYRACRKTGDLSMLALPALAGVMVGAVDEWFQWFVPARVGELRDVGLNLAGVATGLLFSVAVDPPERLMPTLSPHSSRLTARFAATALLVLAAFVDVIHLGHRIVDDEIGAFESRFSAVRLGVLQADRAGRWIEAPPPRVLARLSREDQYLTEAAEHAQERNERWEAGDMVAAWSENRILEKYYAPALDARWYGAPQGLRWPAAQRADSERRAGDERASRSGQMYESAAYPYPIFAWPRWLFWMCAGAAIVVALVLGELYSYLTVRSLRLPRGL